MLLGSNYTASILKQPTDYSRPKNIPVGQLIKSVNFQIEEIQESRKSTAAESGSKTSAAAKKTRSDIASVSGWTCKISQAPMQAKFISYVRKGVRKNTNKLFVVQLVLSLIVAGISIPDSEM